MEVYPVEIVAARDLGLLHVCVIRLISLLLILGVGLGVDLLLGLVACHRSQQSQQQRAKQSCTTAGPKTAHHTHHNDLTAVCVCVRCLVIVRKLLSRPPGASKNTAQVHWIIGLNAHVNTLNHVKNAQHAKR
jgi:hypothetical protein